ncbi:MAG: flagellar filament capping protein FliD [Betaproteobacteria bacterium]|nr:flagellar filament capping protein FliD [Betaproteobacteria bacterium]
MAAVSGSGGATLDVNSIVSQLMQVESRPLARLDQKEASYQAKLSAYGSLSSAISSFQSAMGTLASSSKFLALKAAASDADVLAASAGAAATEGSYSIEITTLAQQQKLAATGVASVSATIGTGASTTLTFDLGTISGGSFDSGTGKYTGAGFTSSGNGTASVTIDATNNTLAGIRDAINAAELDVTASIVNDGGASPYRLVLTSASTGAANSMKISVSGDATISSLLAHDPQGAPAAQNLSEKATARNAALTVDGLSISSDTNTLTEVISGVTLTLKQTNENSPLTLTVANQSDDARNSAQAFVDAYNALDKSLKTLTSYDAATKIAGPLQGDGTTRLVRSSIRSILSDTLTGAGAFTTLTELGIGFQRDGSLELDTDKLEEAIASDAADVAAVFAQTARATDLLVTYSGASSSTKPGTYAVNITQMATRGTALGGSAAGLTITGGVNDTLEVSLDGYTATVTLAAGVYASADALALEVQSKINSAGAFSTKNRSIAGTSAAGVITLTSATWGSESAISITGGNGAANLLGASPTNTAGVDIAGTIDGLAATGTGQTLTAADDESDAFGLRLLISGGSIGARGTVSFSQGYADQLERLASEYLDSSGAIANRTDGIGDSIADIDDQRDRLNIRLALIEQRYRLQFTALDRMLSSMNQTQMFLTQQMNNLPGFSDNSSGG